MAVVVFQSDEMTADSAWRGVIVPGKAQTQVGYLERRDDK